MFRKLWRDDGWKGLLALAVLNAAYLIRFKNNYIEYFSAGGKAECNRLYGYGIGG